MYCLSVVLRYLRPQFIPDPDREIGPHVDAILFRLSVVYYLSASSDLLLLGDMYKMTLLLFFFPWYSVPKGAEKLTKTKSSWNDRQSGWSSTQKLSCNKTPLNRCMTTEMRWKRN